LIEKTKEPLIKTLVEVMIEQHVEVLVNMETSGLASMIQYD